MLWIYCCDLEPMSADSIKDGFTATDKGFRAILDCAQNIVVGDIIEGIDAVRDGGSTVAEDRVARKVRNDAETLLDLVFGDVDVEVERHGRSEVIPI